MKRMVAAPARRLASAIAGLWLAALGAGAAQAASPVAGAGAVVAGAPDVPVAPDVRGRHGAPAASSAPNTLAVQNQRVETSLHDAFEAAWQRQPAAQAQAYRNDAFTARQRATESWVAAPPSLAVRDRSDRLTGNDGAREFETELAVPLWLPGQRERESAVVTAERAEQLQAQANARWKLAGEVREAFWQIRAAEVDRQTAQRHVDDAVALGADVERRFKVGDLARTDFNLARADAQSARGALIESEARLVRAQQSFKTLTGLMPTLVLNPGSNSNSNPMPAPASSSPSLAEWAEAPTASPPPLADHPALRVLDQAAIAADMRLRLAAEVTRDNPEFTVGYRREHGARSNDPYDNSLIVGIRIPFSTEARNQPKVAAANADYIEARTAQVREQERVEAEVATSQGELMQRRAQLTLAEERQHLAVENDGLLAKAFRLGEIDFATRRRTAAERFAADADVATRRLDAARAVSRLNQALGVLP